VSRKEEIIFKKGAEIIEIIVQSINKTEKNNLKINNFRNIYGNDKPLVRITKKK
jgi:hypothetical protein